jgi:MFS transporter, DHA1 family, multidrug resistance protein
MLGPFSMDTYLPAFLGIAQSLNVSPAQMQQTMSAYLLGSAFMMLFHGALSDSYGRRPIILAGLTLYTIGSMGCALAPSLPVLIACRVLQGMAVGAGFTVGRAIIRDLFDDVNAQKVLSMVSLIFGVSPVIAPMIGGVIYAQGTWRGIFWLLAALGLLLLVWVSVQLRETHPRDKRIAFSPRSLSTGYRTIIGSPRFLLLALASSIPFNGFFIYVLSAPTFLGEQLRLAPTQFFWFFGTVVIGLMSGSALSGRLAGRIRKEQQAMIGFSLMLAITVVNVAYAASGWQRAPWAFVPVAIYAFAWSLVMPLVTVTVLDLFPERRGMASSLQGALSSLTNAITAGVLAPLVMHSGLRLSVAALLLAVSGWACWWGHQRMTMK